MRLVLFDIDGTLLSAGGASRRAVERALHETFDTTGPIDTWAFGGKTDPQICRELLAQAGMSCATVDAHLPACLDRYVAYLAEELPRASCELKPGFPILLDRLASEPEVVLGLLTGNIEAGARLKLAHFGLLHYFPIGVYGSDHADRYQLPALAVQRAKDRFELAFAGKQVVIIGDTPHDVGCGRSLGVRSIAVATGRHRAEELAGCQPDYLFDDLSRTDEVLASILS